MTTYNLGTVVGTNGTDGRGIRCIQKTDTTGNTDTYTIYYTDETTSTFEVTNGEGADIVTAWETTPSDTKVPSEKLVKNTLDTKQASLVSGTNIKTINNNSLLGSGNIDIQGGGGSVDIDTSFPSTPSDTHVPSTKLVKNSLDAKVTGSKVNSWSSTVSNSNVPSEKLVKDTIDGLSIPTKISDLTNDSDFIETSSTSGLIKNDGTVMTSGTGSTNYSAGNHTHSGYVSATKVTSWSSTVSDSNVPSEKLVKDSLDVKVNTSDIADNLTTTTAGKVLDARQGKALADLIGDAIDYINL